MIRFTIIFIVICASTSSLANNVRHAQNLLVDLGFYVGPVDGIYGEQTKQALEKFYIGQNDKTLIDDLSSKTLIDLYVAAGFSESHNLFKLSNIADTSTTFFNTKDQLDFLSENPNIANTGCKPKYGNSLINFRPSKLIGKSGYGGGDQSGIEYARVLNGIVGQFLKTSDEKYAKIAIQSLREFAKSDAWQPVGTNSAYWSITAAMGHLLPAWQALRFSGHVSIEDMEIIDVWIQTRLADARLERQPDGNHNTLRSVNDAIEAVINDDDESLRKAILLGYISQLHNMRSDGSFPYETQRGQMALVYTSRNIASMVLLAEIAANQGFDLYSISKNGRNLASAIQYFIAAYHDNSLIDKYAKSNYEVPNKYQNFVFNNQENPFRTDRTGWILLWLNRFNTAEFNDDLLSLYSPSKHKFIQAETTGGQITCYVGWRMNP